MALRGRLTRFEQACLALIAAGVATRLLADRFWPWLLNERVVEPEYVDAKLYRVVDP